MTIATRLADWVADLRYDHIPRAAVDTTKLLVLDQLGLQVNGATLANIQPEIQLVEAMQAIPESTVALSGTRTAAPYAAFVNGTLAGSSEFDDVHMYAAHIGSHVVPPALAFAETTDATGREVITAIVAGAQVMSLLGGISVARMVGRGWHGSKILGTLGAAATAGKLLGLTPAQLANALAIAASDAGGGMEYEFSGGEVKRMHSGSAARLGSQAALLAQRGLTGPLTIVEGPRGLLRLFAEGADPAGIEALWDRFHVTDTAFRMYPTIGSAATVLDGLRQLRDGEGLDWREITAIRLGLPHIAIGHGATVTHPRDAVSAQFSTAFGVGLMLVHGSNRPEDYLNPDLLADPDILRVVDLVRPYAADFPPGSPVLSARIDITLRDGRVLSHLQKGFRGHQDDPGRAAAVEAKFRDNIANILPVRTADEIVSTVDTMDRLDAAGRLVGLTVRRSDVAGETDA
ncbi:MAG TPA: MmgE/PrpD family protein [Pseudonocardiaceae bacterium]|jgi:2-methylcitrate dehydratase PrpD|nr:MmgE/PrpD family protein [Pseudonocardiaceae bacterium]